MNIPIHKLACSAMLSLVVVAGTVQSCLAQGPYKVIKTAKVGGDGGFDYVYADSDHRNLYIPRSGPSAQISVFNLDTLSPSGELAKTNAHGAVTDTQTHHSFATSSPIAMWDSRTLAPIKTIDVKGRPDGILADSFNHRIYILSHEAPEVTVIDAKDGAILGTIDIGGAPEQAASDGKGLIFIDIEDAASVAVIDAKAMKMKTTYSLDGKGKTNAGLALDVKNHVLFVACREPQVMVMLDSNTGKYLADLPIGRGCDGAGFNPKTGECFSSQGDGTLTVIKETSPTTFEVVQNVKTMTGAKTMTIDSKTGHILLIAAEYGPAPANAEPQNGRPRRGALIPGSFSIIEVGK